MSREPSEFPQDLVILRKLRLAEDTDAEGPAKNGEA